MKNNETESSNFDRLRRLKEGDYDAFGELFAQHQDRLLQIIRFRLDRRLVARLDPEDVLQQVFLDASARIRHYVDNHSGSFFVWLRLVTDQTMANIYRMHLDTQMRDARRDVSINAGKTYETPNGAIAMQLVSKASTPSKVFSFRESVERLEDAISKLKPMDREAIELRHYELLDNKEVAELLGINEKAASIRYVRAIRRLKEVILPSEDSAKVVEGHGLLQYKHQNFAGQQDGTTSKE